MNIPRAIPTRLRAHGNASGLTPYASATAWLPSWRQSFSPRRQPGGGKGDGRRDVVLHRERREQHVATEFSILFASAQILA
jgi:hypothetical protein